MATNTMLFKFPGAAVQLQDGRYDTIVIDADLSEAFAAATSDGWHPSPAAAKVASEAIETAQVKDEESAPPTLEELTQHAVKLGINVDGRWSAKRIAAEIAAAGGV